MTSTDPLVLAVGTGVVVIVVAVAVVLVVLLVTLSMRGRQRRGAQERREARGQLDEAEERAWRAEHERDTSRQGGEDLGQGK
jgi:flagellar biosynthesis/type III secretory pathway M-ring protein FliF/YscJ